MLLGSLVLPGIPNNLDLSWRLQTFHYFWGLQNQDVAEIQGNLALWISLDGMDCSEIQYNQALAEIRDGLDLFWSLQRMDCSSCWDSLDWSEDLRNLDNPEFSNTLENGSETLNSQGTPHCPRGCCPCSRRTCWHRLFTPDC